MVKVVSFSFEQCFDPFIILFVKGSSESRFFRHLSNHVFPSTKVQKSMSYEDHFFFFKCSNLHLNLENSKTNWENIFRFCDNYISKCCYELSLSRRHYFLQGVNGLTNSPNILHITQRNFFNLNHLHRDQ